MARARRNRKRGRPVRPRPAERHVVRKQLLDLRFPEQTEFVGLSNYGTVLSSETSSLLTSAAPVTTTARRGT